MSWYDLFTAALAANLALCVIVLCAVLIAAGIVEAWDRCKVARAVRRWRSGR